MAEEAVSGVCVRCKGSLAFGTPPGEIMNGDKASVLVIQSNNYVCQNCGLRYKMIITGVQGIQFRWDPIKDTEETAKESPRVVITDRLPKGLVRPS